MCTGKNVREQFINTKFQQKTLELIDRANAIIAEYEAQGFVLTLRQLYYQFVARQLVENSQQSYKRLGSIMNDARQAGLIDWDALEDRTRHLRTHPAWSDPANMIESAAVSYREDLWAGQSEVWIEKDARLGVIEGVCNELRVPYFACRGNNSQSEQYKAGMRYAEYLELMVATILCLYRGEADKLWLARLPSNWHAADAVASLSDAAARLGPADCALSRMVSRPDRRGE
jgi:hypothetical protein